MIRPKSIAIAMLQRACQRYARVAGYEHGGSSLERGPVQ